MFEQYEDRHFELIKPELAGLDSFTIEKVEFLCRQRNFSEIESVVGEKLSNRLIQLIIGITQRDTVECEGSEQESADSHEEIKDTRMKSLRKAFERLLTPTEDSSQAPIIERKKSKKNNEKTGNKNKPVKKNQQSKKEKGSLKTEKKTRKKDNSISDFPLTETDNIKMADFSGQEKKIEAILNEEKIYAEELISEVTEKTQSYITPKLPQEKNNRFKFYSQLPIHDYVDEIIQKVSTNRVTIISGDTGCGKTTQVPQILNKIFKKTIIALPKRVAAISIAQRVAVEMNTKLGGVVGYKVRWDEKYSENTKILFVTDGIMSLECLNGNIKKYDLIVIDEFHERKMDYDFILSYFFMNKLSRLLLMSATIDIEHYQKLFKAALVSIPIRKYSNTIYYLKDSNFDVEKDIIETISRICRQYEKGDILVFLPGMREIEDISNQIQNTLTSSVEIIKLASSYSTQSQMKIFQKMNKRKIILSTNIAESSVTVNDLVFVIDSGKVRRSMVREKAESLETIKISKSSAIQRAGRVGRICPGHVFRMYTQNDYSIFKEDLLPETACSDITSLVLKFLRADLDFTLSMKLIGYNQIRFYKESCFKLLRLGLMDQNRKLTEIGKKVSTLPLKIEHSKTLLKAVELDVFFEVAIICAFLEVDRIFYDDKRKQQDISTMLKSYSDGMGDHISYLNLYIEGSKKNFSSQFCHEHFIKPPAIIQVTKTFNQTVRNFGYNEKQHFKVKNLKKGNSLERIAAAFCDGFRLHIAKKQRNYYVRMTDKHNKVGLLSGSTLLPEKPDLVLYDKIIHTSRFLMKNCLKIEPKILLQLENAFQRTED